MAEVDLEYLADQMQRLLSELEAVRGALDIIRRDQSRMKSNLNTVLREIKDLRADMRKGFDLWM